MILAHTGWCLGDWGSVEGERGVWGVAKLKDLLSSGDK